MKPADGQRRDRLAALRSREGRGRTSQSAAPVIHTNLAMWPLSQEEREQAAARQAARAKEEEEARKADGERYERYLAKVEEEERKRAEQAQLEADAIAAMSPMEFDAFKKRVPVPMDLVPKLPPRYVIAVQDLEVKKRKRANAEREARERELKIPQRQAAHFARVQELRDERLAGEAEGERIKQAAREREQEQLAELGPAPTLESLQVKA
jgi:hypothetical protein